MSELKGMFQTVFYIAVAIIIILAVAHFYG